MRGCREGLLKINFHHYLYVFNKIAIVMDNILPSHFEGWNPRTRHYFDKLNKEWATDIKFKQLGDCYENFLLKAFKNHDNAKLSINKNRPNTQGDCKHTCTNVLLGFFRMDSNQTVSKFLSKVFLKEHRWIAIVETLLMLCTTI